MLPLEFSQRCSLEVVRAERSLRLCRIDSKERETLNTLLMEDISSKSAVGWSGASSLDVGKLRQEMMVEEQEGRLLDRFERYPCSFGDVQE